MPKRLPQELKDKALELWKSGKELEEISKELKLPFDTLKTWHARGNWKQVREDQKKANDRKVTEKIAKADAKEKFNVRKEMIQNFKDAKAIRNSEAEKAIEKASLLNVEHKYLEHIGKIDQIYIDQSEVKHKFDDKQLEQLYTRLTDD